MDVLIEAGLPAGVINMVFSGGAETSKQILEHPDFSGIHFHRFYRSFPIVMETNRRKIFINIKLILEL